MIKCIGKCSICGRCINSAVGRGTDNRKATMLTYPEDFTADKGGSGFGAAFDIGTTTVVGMLWDLAAGEQLAAVARMNPQNQFGVDVISRITYCRKSRNALEELRNKITECMNEMVSELCSKGGTCSEKITKAVVCGNTTMSHLFAGYSPMTLALAPFAPAYEGTLRMQAAETGLNLNKDAQVTVMPNIAGHVGGDITAGILAARILETDGVTLFIDIGTNGEIVLTDGARSLACSTAAGPAFEGTITRNGMRGSELIDAIAQMLDAGIIDKTGRLISADQAEENMAITQKDIREVQLAKGAISAGVQIMLRKLGKTADDIDRVIVAGAFGNYINKESAVKIGILPDIAPEKIIFEGNTAGAGVSMALACGREMERAEQIPADIEHIELAAESDFQEIYLKSMNFCIY